jgi:hypothetical protein
VNVDDLEVVAGFEHQNLQGQAFEIAEAADETELRDALEKAFDYRGDVTITLKNGSSIEGYIFDRRSGATLADSCVRLFPKNDPKKTSVSYADIAGLAFSGRDTAAGKSWEAWVKKYWEKKNAGEKNIELKPENLD